MTQQQFTSDAVFAVSIVGFAIGALFVVLIMVLLINYCLRYKREEMSANRQQEHMKYMQKYATQSGNRKMPDNAQMSNYPLPLDSEFGMVSLEHNNSDDNGRYYLTDGTNSLVVSHLPRNLRPSDELTTVVQQINFSSA